LRDDGRPTEHDCDESGAAEAKVPAPSPWLEYPHTGPQFSRFPAAVSTAARRGARGQALLYWPAQ